MQNELKKITSILFGSEELSSSIYNDTYKINELTQTFNKALEIRHDSREALRSTHLSETVVAPLPFYGVKNKDKFDFVYMQLTPDYEDTKIHLEKQSAGDQWQSYYEFYTSKHILDIVKDNASFNRSLSKLLFALSEQHELGKIALEDIATQLEIEQADVLSTLLADKSILLPHIVPFHSHGFDTNMNGINHLRETIPAYDHYLKHLLEYIKSNTEDHGLIMSNGFADSRVIHSLLDEDGATPLLENQLLSFLKWDTKYAVLFNDHLISRHGLRTDTEIDKIVSIISSILKNQGDMSTNLQELKDYCDVLLEKRLEDDFKDRGKRIKGTKSKGFKVKKLIKE